MNKSSGIETFRSLSQLEGEMKKAERDYIQADTRLRDADSRLRDAEAQLKAAESHFLEAQYAYDGALRMLNECHSDIDRTVEMLREASPPGCEWKSKADRIATGPALEMNQTVSVPADFILRE